MIIKNGAFKKHGAEKIYIFFKYKFSITVKWKRRIRHPY